MAQLHYTHDMGSMGFDEQNGRTHTSAKSLKKFTNLAGAAISMALIIGVAVWSYNLIMRDVSGIPVVRAAEGDMRIRPDNPGGQLAQNTGLSVNEVAAEGTAGELSDRVYLAPGPQELASEDMSFAQTSVAPVQQPPALDVTSGLNGTGSLSDHIDSAVSQVVDGQNPAAQNAVVVSLRPALRPTNLSTVAPAIDAPTAVREIDSATLASGTHLVQLGAFENADVARQQWGLIEVRFGEFFTDKARVIQQSQSGGQTFFRLRAHGFTDMAEARRFCAALISEGADCVPLVTQ